MNTQFFINGDNVSLVPRIQRPDSTLTIGGSSAVTGRVYDLSFLPGDITDIPDLRAGPESYNQVKVNYNELENFFKNADRTTKFENLYDVLVAQACQTMYTENPT